MFCFDLPVKRCERDRAWLSQPLLLSSMQNLKVWEFGRLIVTFKTWCVPQFPCALCTSQIEASTSPPGQPPGHLNFWKIFVQIPPSRGRKTVQMPHHRSIPGDQMPPPPGNFSVAFTMLRKLCT